MTPVFDPDLVLPNSGKHADHGKQIGPRAADYVLSRPTFRAWLLEKVAVPLLSSRVQLQVASDSPSIPSVVQVVVSPRRRPTDTMGWLQNWMARRTSLRDGPQYRVISDDIHDGLPAIELRRDKDNRRGNNKNRNKHTLNGGRRGDSADQQGGGNNKNGNGDNNGGGNGNGNGGGNSDKNKNSTFSQNLYRVSSGFLYHSLTCSDNGKDDGGKKKPSDTSKSPDPSSSFTTTIVSIPPPTTVVVPPVTLTSTLVTTTEISTTSTQTESSATPTSFTISITTSVTESPSSPVVTPSSVTSSSSPGATSVTPTTVLPTPPSTSTSTGNPGAIFGPELSAGAKAGIASKARPPWEILSVKPVLIYFTVAALSAFALILGGLYLCWRRGASRTRRPIGVQPETPGVQGSLVQGAVGMAQAERRSVNDNTKGQGAPDTSSWRTWHPYRPPSAQPETAAAAADLLVPPAPAFSRSTQDVRRTLNTWDTSSEPDSSAADRFSTNALATHLSPAPTRPRRIPGSTDV